MWSLFLISRLAVTILQITSNIVSQVRGHTSGSTWLAQLGEDLTFDLGVMSFSPTLDIEITLKKK